MKKNNVRLKYRTELKADHQFDFKDAATLYRYIGEAGKIVPSRISKLSMRHQRNLTRAIEKARNLALLPVGAQAYDDYYRPQILSPKPFELD